LRALENHERSVSGFLLYLRIKAVSMAGAGAGFFLFYLLRFG
jgi:hypothetical protein